MDARTILVGRQSSCGELVSSIGEPPDGEPPGEDEEALGIVALIIAIVAVIAIAFGGGSS